MNNGWEIIRYLLEQLFKGIYRTINPITFTRDKAIINNLYELCKEVEKFILYSNKGPVQLDKYKMKNVLFETNIEFKFISSEFSKQRRIWFGIKASNEHVLFGTGGNSAGGTSHHDKDKIDYDKIAEEMYQFVDRSQKPIGEEKIRSSDDYWKWKKEVINPILEKYQAGINFYCTRRALIMMTHEENEPKYIQAKRQLLEKFKDEETMKNFVEEIIDNYTAKIVLERLL